MNSKASSYIFLLCVIITPIFFISAQSANYTPLVGNIPGLVESTASSNLPQWLARMYQFLIGIAGVLAVLMIFWAGFQFVVSGDNAGKRSAARGRILAALGGLLLALSSYIILNTINPQLVQINLNFDEIATPNTVNLDGSIIDPNSDAVQAGSNSWFFGSVQRDPNFVRHDDYNNPLWNYYHGTGTIPTEAQINTGIGIPRATPTNVSPGNTNGSITLSYFGGPIDVRTKGGYALQYCNNRYGGRVDPNVVETTTVGNTTYSWCYALDSAGNKIYFPGGRASAHGGYFETAAVSGERFSVMNPQAMYVAYPLNGRQISELPDPTGVSNTRLRNYTVAVTAKSGRVFTGYIADRGPHASLNKLDVSKGMYDALNREGGAASARLLDANGNTVTSF